MYALALAPFPVNMQPIDDKSGIRGWAVRHRHSERQHKIFTGQSATRIHCKPCCKQAGKLVRSVRAMIFPCFFFYSLPQRDPLKLGFRWSHLHGFKHRHIRIRFCVPLIFFFALCLCWTLPIHSALQRREKGSCYSAPNTWGRTFNLHFVDEWAGIPRRKQRENAMISYVWVCEWRKWCCATCCDAANFAGGCHANRFKFWSCCVCWYC